MKYVGFWRRFGASIIDGLVTLPFVVLFEYANGFSQTFAAVLALPSALFYAFYRFYFHARWGATIGKRAMKIKVMTYDREEPISYAHAGLRISVDTLFATVMGIATIYAIYSIDAETYLSLGWAIRSSIATTHAPNWYEYTIYLAAAWGVINLLSLLVTDKKRAMHDYIAGTVVVHQPSS